MEELFDGAEELTMGVSEVVELWRCRDLERTWEMLSAL